jgi:hypothetical protein
VRLKGTKPFLSSFLAKKLDMLNWSDHRSAKNGMGRALSVYSKPIIATAERCSENIASSCRSSFRTIRQTLTTHCSDHPLDVRTLPRRSWRYQHFLNAKLFHLPGEITTEDAVAVAH